ncbi:MAG: XRE family transcriptional regulator [Negativicutes bacterium]|nr:XRE family transcriptional regulator [Negativicutes bacterium]
MLRSNLRTVMEMRGVSFRNLERISGVSLRTIHKARKDGHGNIESCTLSTLSALAGALGVSVKDLFEEV